MLPRRQTSGAGSSRPRSWRMLRQPPLPPLPLLRIVLLKQRLRCIGGQRLRKAWLPF